MYGGVRSYFFKKTEYNILYKFSPNFPENRIWHLMQTVSIGDNLYEISNPIFCEKIEQYYSLSSAEIFTQRTN